MDKKRLKMMVRLAMFEQVDGKEDIEISHYFRGDYIGIGLLKNAILVTVAYVIILALVAIYNFEFFAASFSNMNIHALLIGLLICYILLIALFSVIVFIKRKLRYEKAVHRIQSYHKKLLELEKSYEREELAEKKGRKAGK